MCKAIDQLERQGHSTKFELCPSNLSIDSRDAYNYGLGYEGPGIVVGKVRVRSNSMLGWDSVAISETSVTAGLYRMLRWPDENVDTSCHELLCKSNLPPECWNIPASSCLPEEEEEEEQEEPKRPVCPPPSPFPLVCSPEEEEEPKRPVCPPPSPFHTGKVAPPRLNLNRALDAVGALGAAAARPTRPLVLLDTFDGFTVNGKAISLPKGEVCEVVDSNNAFWMASVPFRCNNMIWLAKKGRGTQWREYTPGKTRPAPAR